MYEKFRVTWIIYELSSLTGSYIAPKLVSTPLCIRNEFVSVAEDAGITLLTDLPKLQLQPHPDFEIVKITIHDLSGQFYTVIQFGNPYGIRRLIDILMGRDTDDGIGEQLSLFLDFGLFQLLILALRANQTRRKKFQSTFCTLVGFKPVSLRNLSPIS